MHVDDWVERLSDAAVEGGSEAVRRTLQAAVRDPEVATTLGFEGALCGRILWRSALLTVTAHRWPPGMSVPPHDHRMASVVGVVAGAEVHATATGTTRVAAGEVLALPDDVVHALSTPPDGPTVALHAYLGDLFAADRTTWDPVSGAPAPLREGMIRALEDGFNARARLAPITADRTGAVLGKVVAELRGRPPAPGPTRTASGVAYDDRGRGRPVVLIHGLTFGRRAWEPVVGRLPDLRCVSLDLPGHGDTGDGPGLGPDDAIRAVREVVEALGLVDPIVVGHSAGAIIALRYVARYGAAGLVLVDQPLVVEPFARQVRSLAPALRGPSFPLAWERFERSMGYRALPHAARTALFATHRVRQEAVAAAWAPLLDGDPAELAREIDVLLAGMRVPVLSVHGAEVGPYAAWLGARAPQARVECWPGGGHFPQVADAPRFAQRLRSFVHGAGPLRLESVPGCPRLPIVAAQLEASGVPWSLEWVPAGHFAAAGEKGPALYDGALRLLELGPILAHVGERSGLLADPDRRARTLPWLALAQQELAPALIRLRAGPDPAAQRAASDALGAFAAGLAGRDWLVDELGPADLAALPLAGFARAAAFPLSPVLAAWIARVGEHPAVRRALARIAPPPTSAAAADGPPASIAASG